MEIMGINVRNDSYRGSPTGYRIVSYDTGRVLIHEAVEDERMREIFQYYCTVCKVELDTILA